MNQIENQNEIQFDNQNEIQFEKSNIGCRLFIEQIELILQMPENERKDFLWALIMNAYCKYRNQNENQIDYQNENQIECAYVSVSVSDSVSVLNTFNKLIFNTMEKTVRFKKFSSNYGGTRENAGRKAKTKAISPDLFYSDNVNHVFDLYKEICTNLIPLKFEKRTRERLDEVKTFLRIIKNDFDYVIELFKKANNQKVFYDNQINFQSLIKNHEKIYAGLGGERPQGNTQKKPQVGMAEMEKMLQEIRERKQQ